MFPALSLLLLAYGNRYLAIAGIVRVLHSRYQNEGTEAVVRQIENLRKRLALIRSMQSFGVVSLILCTASMVLVFFELQNGGSVCFALSLFSMIISLFTCLREILLSGGALEIELSDMEE